MSTPPYPALATDVVRYVGQPVLAIVAPFARAGGRRGGASLDRLRAAAGDRRSGRRHRAGRAAGLGRRPRQRRGGGALRRRRRLHAAFAARPRHATSLVMNQRLAPVTLEPRAGAAVFDAEPAAA
jgi:hypothetical protein